MPKTKTARKKTAAEKKKSVFSNPWVKYGGIALLIVLVIAGIVWWLIARQYEDTEHSSAKPQRARKGNRASFLKEFNRDPACRARP